MRTDSEKLTRGHWMALAGALLGWMFDGAEMGVFSLVGRPALRSLLGETDEARIGFWFGAVTAGFLAGAATGGVLFGWLGDRIGRVRAMTLSVLTYAVFTGLCGLTTTVEQLASLRFIASLGMGGEWSLGVALVMEIWPDRTRALLAGLIGAAANVGYLLIAVVGLGLSALIAEVAQALAAIGLSDSWVQHLTDHQGWRLLMICGTAPALLTFFIRLFVPESKKWQSEQSRGTTSLWAVSDLLGVGFGALGPLAILYLWIQPNIPMWIQISGTLAGLLVAALGYTFPVVRYFRRALASNMTSDVTLSSILNRMFLAAALSGVALLGSWATVQWAPSWADKLTAGEIPAAKGWTQIWSSAGAICGTILAALAGNLLGRRATYALMCLAALGSVLLFYQANSTYNDGFLVSICLAGFCAASFYGWLPLYLPELFPTSIRATGQGFGFNFGRILAAIGVLQTGNLMGLFGGSYPQACSAMSAVYLIGLVLIYFAPETRGRPLPQ